MYFWTFPQHDQIILGALFIKINVDVCTNATHQRTDRWQVTVETNSFRKSRLVDVAEKLTFAEDRPLKETELSAGFSNFQERWVSPQQRRRLL